MLFGNETATTPNFCHNSVITPSITGLFNGEALRAMWDLGIRNLCGTLLFFLFIFFKEREKRRQEVIFL